MCDARRMADDGAAGEAEVGSGAFDAPPSADVCSTSSLPLVPLPMPALLP